MRVCMLAYAFYESDNRVMRYAETLASQGHHVDVIALRKPGRPKQECLNGVHVHRIQERVINESGPLSYLKRIVCFLFKSAWFVTKKHLKHPYKLIHVHSVPDFEVFAALIPKLLGAKVILDIHDIVPEFFASKFGTGHKGLLYRLLIWMEKISIAFSDHVIISNHLWKKTLERRSVRPEKCTAIINYPDLKIFRPDPTQRNDDKFIMLYPGTINHHQGLDIAVKAFARIKDAAPHACFHIYGEGPTRQFLIDLIRQYGLENRIQVFDPLPLREIAQIMATADLGVIPKRNDPFGGQAFSTKTMEFMACNVPIIVSRTKIDDFYFNNSIVRFFRPEDPDDLAKAMLELIISERYRNTLVTKTNEFIWNHRWGTKKKIYLDLVDDLLGKAACHPKLKVTESCLTCGKGK